jgi:carbonic anhydrase
MDHGCEAIVVTCIDFRLQNYINKWIDENFAPFAYDRVAFAGGVKNLDIILEQIGVSKKLHGIKKVVLINHEECGAYGDESTPQKHAQDLKNAALKIKTLFPDLQVDLYYLQLNGKFEAIS